MSLRNIPIPPGYTVFSVNTLSTVSTVLLLPTCSTNTGRFLMVKDIYGNASNNPILLSSQGSDLIDGRLTRYPFSTSWGTLSLLSDGGNSWRVTGFYNGGLTPAAPAGASLYSFTSITFTNAGVSGASGPNLSQCVSAYQGANPWVVNTSYFNMSNTGIQLWTVPQTTSYSFSVAGARGGAGGGGGYGLGALLGLTLNLTSGHILAIAVGQIGIEQTSGCGGSFSVGGGGGGTFVYNTTTSTWLVVAGGGGGGGSIAIQSANNASLTTSGNTAPLANGGAGGTGGSGGGASTGGCATGSYGGGGITGDGGGSGGGKSYTNGLSGGTGNYGGFGGGGGIGTYGGGGGGGYSGGGGGALNTCSCSDITGGGGGGSYGIVSFTSSAATNAANGFCTVLKL